MISTLQNGSLLSLKISFSTINVFIGVTGCVRNRLLEQSEEGSRLHVRQLNLRRSCGHSTIEHRIEDRAAHGQHKPNVKKKKNKQKEKLMSNQIHFLKKKSPG